MSYMRVAGRATRAFCTFLFSTAVFLLWASLAAGAGFILVQLPDVWAVHSHDETSRYAVMAVTAFALIDGAMFLIFAAGSVARLSDALMAARTAVRHLRQLRAQRRRRCEPVAPVALHPAQNTL
jgi:hypothetical protein